MDRTKMPSSTTELPRSTSLPLLHRNQIRHPIIVIIFSFYGSTISIVTNTTCPTSLNSFPKFKRVLSPLYPSLLQPIMKNAPSCYVQTLQQLRSCSIRFQWSVAWITAAPQREQIVVRAVVNMPTKRYPSSDFNNQ